MKEFFTAYFNVKQNILKYLHTQSTIPQIWSLKSLPKVKFFLTGNENGRPVMDFEKTPLGIIGLYHPKKLQENISKGKINVTYTHVLEAFRTWSTIRISLFTF